MAHRSGSGDLPDDSSNGHAHFHGGSCLLDELGSQIKISVTLAANKKQKEII
jgi:hypothetical protein